MARHSQADSYTVQKIKKDLIHKAKVKNSYSKLKERELNNATTTTPTAPEPDDAAAASLELHPERQAMLEEPTTAEPAAPSPKNQFSHEPKPRSRRPKSVPFEKEARLAQRRKEEAEQRRKAIEDANRQRQQKLEDRERFRKAMAKARTGGRNGQRKLGRESKLLLEKVQRVMSEG